MSRNALKVLACLSMLVDHLGLLLFPEIRIFRYIGRLALPIFAFFLGEGCRHTRSRRRYFFSLFSLGVLCQLVYFVEQIMSGSVNGVYLNILFTLSMSHILCCLFLNVKRSYLTLGQPKLATHSAVFLLAAAVFALFCCLGPTWPFSIAVDYGMAGLFLPLFAVIFSDRKRQFVAFSCGLLLFNVLRGAAMPYTWFSLLALPLLFLYNGEKGH